MLILYRFFYFLISRTLILLKPLLSEKFQLWIDLRQKKILLKRSEQKQRILFHAASGEIEYVKSVIREFKKQAPEMDLYVSYSSPSAEKLFSNISDFVTDFIPLPWDTPDHIRFFLEQLRPSAVIFSRTDFWPELIEQLQQKKIPMMAVSLFPHLGWLQKSVLRYNLAKMTCLTVVTDELKFELKKIIPAQVDIHMLSDTRFDQVLHRLKDAARFKMTSDREVIVWGSTWPEDELVLIQILPHILKSGFQVVWCPHDVSPQRILKIQKQLTDYSVTLFSNKEHFFHFFEQVLILDQIGYLADMYRYSRIAFIGGSFKSKVHSVMEPLCAGNPVIVGPFYKNNPEAIQFEKMGFVQSVHTPIEFMSALKKLIQINQSTLQLETKKLAGSTRKTVSLILSSLKN